MIVHVMSTSIYNIITHALQCPYKSTRDLNDKLPLTKMSLGTIPHIHHIPRDCDNTPAKPQCVQQQANSSGTQHKNERNKQHAMLILNTCCHRRARKRQRAYAALINRVNTRAQHTFIYKYTCVHHITSIPPEIIAIIIVSNNQASFHHKKSQNSARFSSNYPPDGRLGRHAPCFELVAVAVFPPAKSSAAKSVMRPVFVCLVVLHAVCYAACASAPTRRSAWFVAFVGQSPDLLV